MNKKKFRRLFYILISTLSLGLLSIPTDLSTPIKYINRKTNKIETEKVAGEGWLRWLYYSPFGRLKLNAIVKRKFLSAYYGKMMDSPKSVKKIKSFVKNYNIDLSICVKQKFSSFNDFFVRKLKPDARKIDMDSNTITSPADGKIIALENLNDDFIVKGYQFNLKEYLQDDELAKKYEGGTLVVVRLCPYDYHRYHFPISGTIINTRQIDGALFSVSPIALRKQIEIFCENKREYSIIKTKNCGDIIYSEIGATMVGSIIQTYADNDVVKGEEKGYFKFGGSSIILLFKKGKVTLDKDLVKNTNNGYETEVDMGERIGISN